MDKFRRYVGLVFSLSLLIFFTKVPDYHHPYPSKLTPLDDSVIVNLTFGRTAPFKMWVKLTNFLNTCDRPSADSCSQMSQHVDFDTVMGNMSKISERYPDFWGQFSEYMKLDWRIDTPERRRFTAYANRVYGEYMAQIQGDLTRGIWLVNIGWLSLIVFGVICRQFVGDVLCWPFGLVRRVIVGGAVAAKKIHEKV